MRKTFFCGVDLHSNNAMYVVTDQQDKLLLKKRLPNQLSSENRLSGHRDTDLSQALKRKPSVNDGFQSLCGLFCSPIFSSWLFSSLFSFLLSSLPFVYLPEKYFYLRTRSTSPVPVRILSASTAPFNKKMGIVRNFSTLQVRLRAQLTSTDEIVLAENTCAPLCHALRSMLTNTLFLERVK